MNARTGSSHAIFTDNGIRAVGLGDSFSTCAGQAFTTVDRDNDATDQENCAETYKGGWWYKACHDANLNGRYLGGPHSSYGDGIEWGTWHDYNYSLKTVEMKIRPYPVDQTA